MNTSGLPKSTLVNRIIPKNAFDKFTNTKQKRLFVEVVDKIRWTNKLSPQTINLPGKEIQEIQIFEIDLKKNESISELLTIIDKAIPYHIIFILLQNEKIMLSASHKHQHPTITDTSVIDWTFSSNWYTKESDPYNLNLKQSLDAIFSELCLQLSGKASSLGQNIADLIEEERKVKSLQNSINKLQAAIKSSKQFNKKVELNLELRSKVEELELIYRRKS
jgi:hypothetical protein